MPARCARYSRPTTLAVLLLLASTRLAAAEYTIDPARTVVKFEMHSVGGVKQGEFSHPAGTVAFDAGVDLGRVDIVIDARSVQSPNEGVERLLRGPSLLGVDEHPEIVYRARRMTFFHGEPARIDGELTLRGITRTVPLFVSSYTCTAPSAQRCSMVASATFSRSDFGMTAYRLLASDQVSLAIHAEGVLAETPPPIS